MGASPRRTSIARASQDPASPVHADVDSPDVDAREADSAAQEPARSRGAGQALASTTERVAAAAPTAAREADPAAQDSARSRGAGQALASATEHVAATALTAVLLVQLVRTVLCTILFTILGALVGSACKSLAQLLSPSEGGGGIVEAGHAQPCRPALPCRVSLWALGESMLSCR